MTSVHPPEETLLARAGMAARRLAPWLGLVLFGVALWAIHHSLAHESYHDVLRYLRSVPRRNIVSSAALAICAYAVLTRYDALALRHAGKDLPPLTVALGAFVGYAFANTVGMSWISGGSVRYRFYSGAGLSAADVGRLTLFCSATLWLGWSLLTGLALTIDPPPLPEDVHVPMGALRTLGAILLLVVVAYLVLILLKRELRAGRFEMRLPRPVVVAVQVMWSVLDWTCAFGVLVLLLPPERPVSFLQLFGVFLLAHVAGVISQVPGGLGVFEGAVLVSLTPEMPAATVLGALTAYRLIYNVLPLALAAAILAANEVAQRRHHLDAFVRAVAPWVPRLVPPVFAASTLVAGTLLLFSGATPAEHGRLSWLGRMLPLPVLEASHFLGSMAGAGLLLLARGLQRRVDAAWMLTCALLAGGAVASMLKGLDWEEALVLTLMLAALIPCRRHFYRRASLASDALGLGWSVAVVLVLATTAWLGLFSYKHVDYSHDLWWQFTLRGDAPRFLRATVGAIGLTMVVSMARLLRPAKVPKPALPGSEELARVRSALAFSTDSSACLALLGDKSILFSDSGRGFLMYGVEGRSWVSMGSPVGPPDERVELAWRFRELCDRHATWAVFYEVRGDTLPLYVDLGLSLQKLGEQARVSLKTFSLDGSSHKGLRQVVRRIEKEADFEVIEASRVHDAMPELREVSDEWLATKATREKGFSLGYFDERYLCEFPCAVLRQGGRIVAFANLWPGGDGSELSVDLMRHRPDAPRDAMEALFVQAMLWGRERGHEWFDLGMAPLSGMPDRTLAPLWSRVGARVFRHGEHFYNFQGIRQYKEKFDPQWTPTYLASPGGLALPVVLANVAALVSGGMKGVVSK